MHTKKYNQLEWLLQLLKIDSPSSYEFDIADKLAKWCHDNAPDVRQVRLGDNLILIKGDRPKTAIYSHLDTTGFTLGYERELIPIGSPDVTDSMPIRAVGQKKPCGVVTISSDEKWLLTLNCNVIEEPLFIRDPDAAPVKPIEVDPGTAWVFDRTPLLIEDEIVSPYLDNRAGIWAAINALMTCEQVVVCLTTGEEHSGQGALICSRYIYEQLSIDKALISDITWHTDYIKCGQGVALSIRDRMLPRRRFLDQILHLADKSGIPYQREVESSGGSDGAHIQKSGYPIDWVFVGAPEKNPHSDHERVNINDLKGMAKMLTALVQGLDRC